MARMWKAVKTAIAQSYVVVPDGPDSHAETAGEGPAPDTRGRFDMGLFGGRADTLAPGWKL